MKKKNPHHYHRKELNVLFTPLPCTVLKIAQSFFSSCPCDILLYTVSEEKHFLLFPLKIWKLKEKRTEHVGHRRTFGERGEGKRDWKAVIIWNSLLMCIIMSLNVNEIELKDPMQRSSSRGGRRKAKKNLWQKKKNVNKTLFIYRDINI